MNVIENPSDADLLHAYRQTGSAETLETLARRYYGFVLATCRRELGNADLAQDAAQNVLLELVRRAHRLDASKGLASWFFRVALSKSRDLARTESRRRGRELVYETRRVEPSERPEVNALLDGLSGDDREMVFARFVGGYSFEEIGRSRGLSPDAVRMRVNRAVDRLKRDLASAGVLLPLHALLQSPVVEPPRLQPRQPKRHWTPVHPRWIALTAGIVGSVATISLIGKPFASSTAVGSSGQSSKSSVVIEESWVPFYAEVDREGFHTRYWRTKDRMRAIESNPASDVDAEVTEKGSLTMAAPLKPTDPNAMVGTIIKGGPNRRAIEGDAMEAAMLQLPILIHATPPKAPWSLAEALGGKTPKGEMTFRHPDGRVYRITFDASKGNMPSRCDYTVGDFRFDIRVLEWQKVGEGRWFPRKVSHKSTFKGQPGFGTVIEIKNVKLGRDVPPIPPMPKPQRNAIVLDEVRNVWYRIDENWKPITKEVPTTPGSVGGGY